MAIAAKRRTATAASALHGGGRKHQVRAFGGQVTGLHVERASRYQFPKILFAADPLVAKTGYGVHAMQVDNLTDKEEWEQRVFAAFAKRSGLNISECSIKSCKPPMPDICCSLDGSDYFFELAEVVPQVQAQALSTKGVYSSAFPDPDELGPHAMVNILLQKQGKKYETGGFPVDLLLYFNKDFPMYSPDVKSEGADPTEIELAVEECKKSGPFRRVWSYCSWADQAKLLA